MLGSKAATVDAYLAELPAERRAVVAVVRESIGRHLPDGHVEALNRGMARREALPPRAPATCNKRPLSFVALAAHIAQYEASRARM